MNFGLSFAQKEIYGMEMFFPNSSVNNICVSISLKTSMQYDSVNQALNCAVEQFPEMRALFYSEGDCIRQSISSFIVVQYPCLVFRTHREYEAWRNKESSSPLFKFGSLLFHFTIITIDEDNSHEIFIKTHHIISDAIAAKNLCMYICSKLEQTGSAIVQENTYSDVISNEQEYLKSQAFLRDKAFWGAKLSDYTGSVLLQDDSWTEAKGDCLEIMLTLEESESIRDFCNNQSISISCFLYGIAALYKSRTTSCDCVAIGTILHNRLFTWEKKMTGAFARTLPLIVHIDEKVSALEFFSYILTCEYELIRHRKHSFEHILMASDRGNPEGLIDFMVSCQNITVDKSLGNEYCFNWIHTNNHGNALCWHVSDRTSTRYLKFEYDYPSSRMSSTDVQIMHRRIMNIVRQVVLAPSIKVGQIEMLPANEIQQVIYAFNDTSVEYPGEKTVAQMFEEQTEKIPDNIAVAYKDETLTYREMNKKANALANKLREIGIRPDDFVAIIAERGIELITGIFGIIKAGGAYVPIDPSYPVERIRFILEDCRPKAVLKYIANVETEIPVIDIGEPVVWKGTTENLVNVNNPEDLIYCIYTSGTTGEPKGVMVKHKGVANLIHSYKLDFSLTTQDSVLQFANICFDQSCADIFSTLCSGAKLCVVPSMIMYDIEKLHSYMNAHRVTVASLTPKLINEMQQAELTELRLLDSGGEEGDLTTLKHWALGRKVLNTYGPTETTVNATCCNVRPNTDKLTIGKPVANTQVYILNEMNVCGIGMPGELCIAGDGVARGYLNQPGLTEEKFIKNPFGEGRLYRSGDLARWLPDGNIEFLGRIDDQVKIRGFRVELGEIESVLRKQPGVADAVVITWETGGEKSLCAYLVASGNAGDKASGIEVGKNKADGNKLDITEIKYELRKELPDHMIPAFMTQLETLPRGRSGKLDRKALPKPDALTGHEYVPPGNEMERATVEVFEEILGMSPIGIEDSFFVLGGDSIKAIRVVSGMRQKGYELAVADLMRHPTIKLLCEKVKVAEAAREYEQGEINGKCPLIPIQHEFFSKNHATPNHFNQALMLRNDGRFDIPALKKALAELAVHHDSLRNVYREQCQITLPSEESELFSWYEYDFINAKYEVAYEIENASTIIQASIDLEMGPLLKTGLFHTESADHLLLCAHHLVIDVVSWRILLEDLFSGYRQVLETGKITLPKKTASYKAWGESLVQYSEKILDEAEYWEKTARDSNEPGAFKSNGTASGVFKAHAMEVDPGTTRKLLFEAGKTYGTEINDLLLASLAIAINRWKKNKYITIEMEGHGREPIDGEMAIDRTVGWFTSVYPVVLSSAATVERTIIETKETLRRVPNNGLGYGVLKYLGKLKKINAKTKISFNYLGDLDFELDNLGVSMSEMSVGRSISKKNTTGTGFFINGGVLSGRLGFDLTYDTGLFEDEDVRAFAAEFNKSVYDVVEACVSKEGVIKTPSDFGISISFEALQSIDVSTKIEKIYELTPLQEGMLFHKLADEKATSYVLQMVFSFCTELHTENMRLAIDALAKKYEVLRTTFVTPKNTAKPLQIVMEDWKIELHEKHVNSIEEKEKIKKADIARGFDLTKDSLLRLTVLREGKEQNTLLWTAHHIIMDGWCLSLLFRDFLKYYGMIADGADRAQIDVLLKTEKHALLSYDEYIKWIGKQNKEEALDYWDRLLEDYTSAITIPPSGIADKQEVQSLREELVLSEKTTKTIEEFASSLNVTVNTVLETAWGVLLQKYNGCDDVVFGKVVAGRNANLPGIEQAVGLFINTIPARITTRDGDTVAKLLKNVQAQAISGMKYDHSSLTEVQSRSRVGNALVQTLFVFENYYIDESIYDGISEFDIKLEDAREEVNYSISMSASKQGPLRLSVMYNSGEYTLSEVKCLLERMSILLGEMVARPNAMISELSVISEAEREKTLSEFNNTYVQFPQGKTVVQLFEEQAAKTPDNTAVVFGNQSITYRKFNEMSNSVANKLMSTGMNPGDFVVICTKRSIASLAGIYGIIKAGGVYVPVDPEYPIDRIEYIIEDCTAKIILTYQADLHGLDTAAQIIDLQRNGCIEGPGDNPEWQSFPGKAPLLQEDKELSSPVYCIFTSGTTGKPKGVVNDHKGLLNTLMWLQKEYQLDENDSILLKTNFTFDVSASEIFWWSIVGASVVLLAPEGEKDPEMIVKTVFEKQVTIMNFVPSAFSAFLADISGKHESVEQLHSLRHIHAAGEALNYETLNTFNKIKKSAGLTAEVSNIYGPTESSIYATYYNCALHRQDSATISIGRPISNTQIYILSGTEMCGIGIPGELCIVGDGLARGYLNQPELTASKFIDNPYGVGKLYRSGDLARWLPDGNIEFLGRIDDQVKIRGFRVELGEVESILRKQPGVADAAVIMRDTGGGKSLCAYLVAAGGTGAEAGVGSGDGTGDETNSGVGEKASSVELDLPEIKCGLSKELPDYMIPAFITQLEALPRSRNGKLDRKALPQPDALAGREHVPPGNEMEQVFVEVFEEILGVSPIGIEDSFFELGGHSLNAIRAINRLEVELGIRLPLSVFFANPRVRGLAEYTIMKKEKREYIEIEHGEEKLYYPTSISQKRLFITMEQNREGLSYNMPAVFQIEGRFNQQRFVDQLKIVMMRHEAFRTTFHVIDGEIVQKVNKEVNIEVNEIELEGRLEELMISSLIKPFNLQHGPLIRVAFCKISESRSYMMLDMHHIISDAESQAVLIRELNSLYNGVALEEQKLQYRDYALWQQEFLKSEEYKKQELFWLNVYKKRPENCYIPTDFVREEVMESRCEKVTFSLPETLNEKLDYFISSHNVTKFMMFLSVANIVVSQYSGRSDVILGIPLAGRQRRELENVMGIFVNTLAVKNNVNYEMKYYEFLSEIRANTLAVFENQDVQLEQLIELLDLNGNIFFNTVFVMQNTSFPEIDLLDAKLTFFEMDYEYSKFDLVISVVDQAHLHEIVFKYNSSLFRRETVETLADMFHEYLRKVIEFPGRPLIEICRLSDPESYELGINPKKELESSILFADFNFNW